MSSVESVKPACQAVRGSVCFCQSTKAHRGGRLLESQEATIDSFILSISISLLESLASKLISSASKSKKRRVTSGVSGKNISSYLTRVAAEFSLGTKLSVSWD